MDSAESISALLDKLVKENPGCVGCMVVGLDGIVIQSNLPENYSIDYLGAGGASLTALADAILKYCSGGHLERLRVGGSQGQMLAIPIADDVALVLITRRSIDTDLAFESAANTALALSPYL